MRQSSILEATRMLLHYHPANTRLTACPPYPSPPTSGRTPCLWRQPHSSWQRRMLRSWYRRWDWSWCMSHPECLLQDERNIKWFIHIHVVRSVSFFEAIVCFFFCFLLFRRSFFVVSLLENRSGQCRTNIIWRNQPNQKSKKNKLILTCILEDIDIAHLSFFLSFSLFLSLSLSLSLFLSMSMPKHTLLHTRTHKGQVTRQYKTNVQESLGNYCVSCDICILFLPKSYSTCLA